MKIKLLKFVLRAGFVIALLLIGFAAGLPVGQSMGFTTGSEWSLRQAALLAREAGLFMPVNYKEGTLRVVVRQPRYLQKKVRQLADKHEEHMKYVNTGKGSLKERADEAQRMTLTQ